MHRETDGVAVDGALIAAAGPVAGGRCALTNSPWVLKSEQLTRAFGLSTVEIVNDLEALAWAIPYLKSADCEAIGGGQERAGEPIVIIAPGTGLGMACLIPGPGGKRVLASEGGHATLAAANEEEAELIEVLRWRYGHVSAERALSGQGLMNLHQAIADRQALPVETRSAEQITRAAIDGRCRQSQLALDVFCSLLGSVAGNAALMFGARGGVYLGGGIAPRIFGYMRRSGFRAQFESKGRFRDYLGRIPTRVIVRADPAFLGLQALATRRD
jgi:glucokinase